MFERLIKSITVIGLVCLLLAGLILSLAHNPDNRIASLWAELLGNLSYGFLLIAFLARTLVGNRFNSQSAKRKK